MKSTLTKLAWVGCLLLPILTAVFLFEAFVQARRESAADEARRILRPGAAYLARLAEPSEALWHAFEKALPNGSKGLTRATADSFRERLEAEFLGRLGIASSGLRIFLFDESGQSCQSGPDAASVTIIHHGLLQMRNRIIPGANPERAPQVFRERFGPFVTMQDCDVVLGFRLVCQTPWASSTHVLRLRSLESYGAIHIEIDMPAIDRGRCLEECFESVPPGIEAAAAIDSDGQVVASSSGKEGLCVEGWPIPPNPEEIHETAEGFFLRKPLPGFPGMSIVVGRAAPFPVLLPPLARVVAELAFVLGALALAGRFLTGTSATADGRQSLVWRVAGLFGFAGVVPFLVLMYFGVLIVVQARQVQEGVWEKRVTFSLRHYDRLFRNRLYRLEDGFRRNSVQVARALTEKKPLVDHLLSGRPMQQWVIGRDGEFVVNYYGRKRVIKRKSMESMERMYSVLLQVFLDYFLDLKGTSARSGLSGGKAAADLAVLAVVDEDSPILQVLRHPDDFHELGFGGLFIRVCVRLLTAPDGQPCGAHMLLIDLALVARRELRKFGERVRVDGVEVFSFLIPNNQYFPPEPSRVDGVPQLVQQVLQTGLQDSRTVGGGEDERLCWALPAAHFEDSLLGATVPTARLEEDGKRDVRLILAVGAATLSVFFLVILQFRRSVLAPLQLLHEEAGKVGEGEFDRRLPVRTNDELGELAGAFNRMTEGLQQQDRIRRFVSTSAWKASEGDAASVARTERYDGAVLFSDIRSFTTISESSSPEAVISLLNDYFTAMDRIIRRNGGVIDKFIGDAIFAVFKPIPDAPDPARRAVIAGLGLRAALSHFNRKRAKAGLFPIENGVGIHYGLLTEGSIGARAGRKDRTVIGSTVTGAMHLEGVSKNGRSSRVIVSPQVVARLGGEYPLLTLEGSETPLFELDRPWAADDRSAPSGPIRPAGEG